MERYRNTLNSMSVKGVISLNQVITPTIKKRDSENMIKQSKFHSLRKKIAAPCLTSKGLVELSKEGK